jgi:hypothetical protein
VDFAFAADREGVVDQSDGAGDVTFNAHIFVTLQITADTD